MLVDDISSQLVPPPSFRSSLCLGDSTWPVYCEWTVCNKRASRYSCTPLTPRQHRLVGTGVISPLPSRHQDHPAALPLSFPLYGSRCLRKGGHAGSYEHRECSLPFWVYGISILVTTTIISLVQNSPLEFNGFMILYGWKNQFFCKFV